MSKADSKTKLLRDARVVLPDRIAVRSILIEKDRIERILDSGGGESVKADAVINLDGLTLFPGFIDIHIHGAVGVDVNEADARGLNKVARFLAENGVTSWLPTLVPDSEENYSRAIHTIDELIRTQTEQEPAARCLGVHYEGPFVNEKQCGALRTEFLRLSLPVMS